MALQAFSHFRHSSAHIFISLSSGNFAHAAAHSLQHFAQHSQAAPASGLCRAVKCAAKAQHSPQSTHRCMHAACSFFPSATRPAQWWKQASHTIWQSAHAFAHSLKCPACEWSAARTWVGNVKAANVATAVNKIVRNIGHFLMENVVAAANYGLPCGKFGGSQLQTDNAKQLMDTRIDLAPLVLDRSSTQQEAAYFGDSFFGVTFFGGSSFSILSNFKSLAVSVRAASISCHISLQQSPITTWSPCSFRQCSSAMPQTS
jgi:hypothetical protein